MIVFGHRFVPTRFGKSIHRREARTYPTRYVVKGPVGWNPCDGCERIHRIWMTDDRTWARLPHLLRSLALVRRMFSRARAMEGAMTCRHCGRSEIWVLDCDVRTQCPSGIDNKGCHYHYACGMCGHEEVRLYDDSVDTARQSAGEIFYKEMH